MAHEPANGQLQVRVRVPCPTCDGTGMIPLEEGWHTAQGRSEKQCNACRGTGAKEKRWISLAELRDLLDDP